MSKVLKNIIQNFIIGGFSVALTSYMGTFLNPLAGAIMWAYPITIIPSIFFMREQGKSNSYIAKFLFSTTFSLLLLLGVTLLLSNIIKNSPEKQSLWIAVAKSSIGFFIGAILYYLVIRVLNLEKYFM